MNAHSPPLAVGRDTPLPFGLDTPFRLKQAAEIAFPDGSVTEKDLARACREGRLDFARIANKVFVTLNDVANMTPGAEVPVAKATFGYVYVVGFDQYVKIGFTAGDVDARVAALATGCPRALKIYAVLEGDRSLEASLHRRFKRLRLKGEWFSKSGSVMDWILEGCPR